MLSYTALQAGYQALKSRVDTRKEALQKDLAADKQISAADETQWESPWIRLNQVEIHRYIWKSSMLIKNLHYMAGWSILSRTALNGIEADGMGQIHDDSVSLAHSNSILFNLVALPPLDTI